MTDKVLQHLLHVRQNVFISGLGRFSLETVPAELQLGSALIQAPAFIPEFQTRPSGKQNSLSEVLQEVYGVSGKQAAGMENSFASTILKSLEENRRYELPGFGVLLASYDASLQFVPEKNRIQSASHFGLRPVSAKQLLVRHQLPAEKEAPVIPLQPFEKTGNKGKKPFRILAYAASGIGIALAAGTLIWLNSISPPQGQQAGMITVPERKQQTIPAPEAKPAKAGAVMENPQPTSEKIAQPLENEKLVIPAPEPVREVLASPVSGESAPQNTDFSGIVSAKTTPEHSGHRHRRHHHRESVQESRENEQTNLPQVTVPAAEVSGLRFHVVAGSFKFTRSAKSAEKTWRRSGYQTARHLLAEKDMIRVSIGSFASKEEAENFRDSHRPEFNSALWILEGE